MAARVTGLRGVEFAVVDLDEAVRFYTEVWHLDPVAQSVEAAYLRGTGRFHHVLTLRRAPRPAIVKVVLDAPDRRAVEQLHAAVTAAGAGAVEAPCRWHEPGGGFGFGFKDPEGRNLAIVAGVDDHSGPCEDRAD